MKIVLNGKSVEIGGSPLPPGGTTGQTLAKASGEDYDAQWVDGATMEQVNTAIDAAITGAIKKVYYGT